MIHVETIKDLEDLTLSYASGVWTQGRWLCIQIGSVRWMIPARGVKI